MYENTLTPGECRNCGHKLTMDNFLGHIPHFNINKEFLYYTDEWLCPNCGEVNVDRVTLNNDREA